MVKPMNDPADEIIAIFAKNNSVNPETITEETKSLIRMARHVGYGEGYKDCKVMHKIERGV